MNFILVGVLLPAALLFSQVFDPVEREGQFTWLTFAESPAEVRVALGNPAFEAHFGDDFHSMQFQHDVADTHDFSHQVVFRVSTGDIVSVTRSWDEAKDVDWMFPPAETTYRIAPASGGYGFAVRKLPGARVLLGIGITARGQKTTQVVLMRESEVRYFYPWLLTTE